jgi:hypothetical protein
MINKLTNQEIAKVLAMYWGQKFRYSGSIGVHRTVAGINRNWNIADDSNEDVSYRVDKCQLLLLRLEDITDEDAVEVAMIAADNPEFNGDAIERDTSHMSLKTKETTVWIWADGSVNVDVKNEMVDTYNQSEIQQMFTQKGYAVPLYLGVGHWANGKTAIELGIAIDIKTLTNG